MKVAVLSDTHGLLREQVKRIIEDSDAVIHAGDVDSREILDQIMKIKKKEAPLYVVRGNADKEWAGELPKEADFSLAGFPIRLIHNKKELSALTEDCRIVIYGHSHRFSQETREGRLWLNPGSCGRRRFTLPITMAVLCLEEGSWRVERLELSGESLPDISQKGPLSLSAIQEILRRMDRGQQVERIGRDMGLSREFVEQICRIRVTHPGVTAEGILDKLEVNRAVTK